MKSSKLSTVIVLLTLVLSACSWSDQEKRDPQQPEAQNDQAYAFTGWRGLLEAGKREGTVAIIGPADDRIKTALTETFQQRSGIAVQYRADDGVTVPGQITAEQRRGTPQWDVYVGDPSNVLMTLAPSGIFDAIEPHLSLEDVRDASTWRDGGIEYADTGRQVAIMSQFQRATLFINTNLVNSSEVTSYTSLLDPRWQGKVLTDDPRVSGNGQGTFAFFYRQPDLGPDFIRALAAQRLATSRDDAEAIGKLSSGAYAFLLGGSTAEAQEAIKKGEPIAIVNAKALREGTDTTAGYGAIAIFKKPAHPSAAQVYLNWLLSKEGQSSLLRNAGYLSKRLDIPVEPDAEWRVPSPSVTGKSYSADAIDAQQKLKPLLAQVLTGP